MTIEYDSRKLKADIQDKVRYQARVADKLLMDRRALSHTLKSKTIKWTMLIAICWVIGANPEDYAV